MLYAKDPEIVKQYFNLIENYKNINVDDYLSTHIYISEGEKQNIHKVTTDNEDIVTEYILQFIKEGRLPSEYGLVAKIVASSNFTLTHYSNKILENKKLTDYDKERLSILKRGYALDAVEHFNIGEYNLRHLSLCPIREKDALEIKELVAKYFKVAPFTDENVIEKYKSFLNDKILARVQTATNTIPLRDAVKLKEFFPKNYGETLLKYISTIAESINRSSVGDEVKQAMKSLQLRLAYDVKNLAHISRRSYAEEASTDIHQCIEHIKAIAEYTIKVSPDSNISVSQGQKIQMTNLIDNQKEHLQGVKNSL